MSNQKPVNIQVVGTMIGVAGLKGNYHAMKHAQKRAKHPLDAGIDLYATRDEPDVRHVSEHYSKLIVHTATHMVFAPNNFGMIVPRSSSIDLLKGGEVVTGIIDTFYTGEILVVIKVSRIALSDVLEALVACATKEIAIAQILPMQSMVAQFSDVDLAKFQTTASDSSIIRGDKGFGSTNRPS